MTAAKVDPDALAADLDAIAQRRAADHARRVAARRRVRDQLQRRRRHGLAVRHATKLTRTTTTSAGQAGGEQERS